MTELATRPLDGAWHVHLTTAPERSGRADVQHMYSLAVTPDTRLPDGVALSPWRTRRMRQKQQKGIACRLSTCMVYGVGSLACFIPVHHTVAVSMPLLLLSPAATAGIGMSLTLIAFFIFSVSASISACLFFFFLASFLSFLVSYLLSLELVWSADCCRKVIDFCFVFGNYEYNISQQ